MPIKSFRPTTPTRRYQTVVTREDITKQTPEKSLTQKITEFTLTGEFKHKDGVILRLEYRGDFSNTPFYLKSGSEPPVKTQNTFTIGMIYAFSTKAS